MTQEAKTYVLMIDDDENDAMLVRHMISKMPDATCQFHWAGSYDQGLRKLSEIDWDLCLVDYNLGAHTGVQVVTESRARGVACPFLLLTGAGNRVIDLQAMRAGVQGYLEKDRLCPLDLERAIRYAIGSGAAQKSLAPVSSNVPAEVVELLRIKYAEKESFVVVSMILDREAVQRNHLSSRNVNQISTSLESMVRAQISSDETLFTTTKGGILLISGAQDARQARQFLSLLLSEPLNLSSDDRSRSVSLAAILRRNVFSSSTYIGPVPLLADLDGFFERTPQSPDPAAKNF
jgi:DNA-binding NarL/FixJ family response regulator